VIEDQELSRRASPPKIETELALELRRPIF
jgi:hypothetical protein